MEGQGFTVKAPRTALLACALALVVAGCGDGGSAGAGRTAAAHRPAPSGCTRAVADTVATAAHVSSVRATPMPPSPGLRGCRYAAGATLLATVTLDSNPQARYRFSRSVEEKLQVALWGHLLPRELPRVVHGIGTGADWIPGDGVLLATDGARFATVVVRAGRDRRAVASAAARAALAGSGGSGPSG